jgi:CheY-like chemotaxis protein
MSIPTILVAEEHDAMRAFLAVQLVADGYQVLVANDRAKALALLSVHNPDLILVDVNGQTLALLDAVRSGEGVAGRVDPATPLIVLSRDADRLQRIRVIETLDGDIDGRPQAEAIARDYLTTVARAMAGEGPAPGDPISEQGGSDARSHRRPCPGPRPRRARGTALPGAAR